MISLLFSLLASSCSSFSNLLFRKNGETAPSPNTYLVFYYLSSLICAIFFFELWNKNFSATALAFGSSVGLLNVALMLATAKALEKGPTGLTFAFQNASAVFPGFILFMLFGAPLGFSFTLFQGIGLLFVLAGLFTGTQADGTKDFKGWLQLALLCFATQVLALTIIQGRCILFDCSQLPPVWNNFALTPQDDGWFALGQLGTSTLFQTMILLKARKGFDLKKRSLFLGLGAGIASFGSTFLLLTATKIASPEAKGLLFPTFCVGNLLICNLWAWRLYQEKFNWKSNTLCTAGIALGIL